MFKKKKGELLPKDLLHELEEGDRMKEDIKEYLMMGSLKESMVRLGARRREWTTSLGEWTTSGW